MKALHILKQYFGYDKFRTGQSEIIDAILNGQDTLGVMPTGAGKSLCFQVPALIFDGITLVVSPLISLMQDQVHALVQSGIPAAYINSALTAAQTRKALSLAAQGTYKIIYVAPERLESPDFLYFAREANISMLAVDEAHCVSHWGQDFRPSYLNIGTFLAYLQRRPVIAAFTATATDIVKEDIIRLLGLDEPFVRTTGFNRENLYFEVRQPYDKFEEVTAYIAQHPGKSGIIYCATRKTVDELADQLNAAGISAARYHAGMAQEERTMSQQQFTFDHVPIVVATNAFGMGIDKSNVSFVIHYNMPKNMESYYQEAGRAGRDGTPADCILLFSRQDIVINTFLIEQTDPDSALGSLEQEAAKARDFRRLREMEAYCTTMSCLRKYILKYFGDIEDCECGNCSSCNAVTAMVDVTTYAQKILSCAHRMRGRFGMVMLIDVLRGAKGRKLIDAELNFLTTYGIMLGEPQEKIRQIANFLIQEGYLAVTGDRYPTVQTTQKAREILQDGLSVQMPAAEDWADTWEASGGVGAERTKKRTEGQASMRAKNRFEKRAKSNANPHDYDVDAVLFEKLRTLRSSLAAKEKVPAFVIFSDSTLFDMCHKMPRTEHELLAVSGVGNVKLEKYGAEFLEILAQSIV